MKKVKAYVKLAIPQPPTSEISQKEWEWVAKEQESSVLKSFREYAASQDGERQKVSADHEDSLWETIFLVETNNGFDEKLIDAVNEFNESLLYHRSNCRGTLILICPNLFEQKIICKLVENRTNRVCFGNIHENEFYNHWQVSFHDKSEKPINCPKNISNGAGLLHELFTFFEFDKTAPVLVEFCVVDKTSKFAEIARYKLAVEGESLRKVVVDGGNRLYFFINYPVKLAKAFLETQPGKRAKMFSPKNGGYVRVLELPWGPYEKMESTRQVLTDNHVFLVEFDKPLDNKKLYSILSRLRHRFNIPVEFTTINHDPANVLQENTRQSPYNLWTEFDKNEKKVVEPYDLRDEMFKEFANHLFPHPPAIPGQRNKLADEMNERKFTYIYLITALLSRGSVVKDQLLLNKNTWFQFLDAVASCYYADAKHYLCEAALEDLINHVDLKHHCVGNIINVFKRLCKQRVLSGQHTQMSPDEYREGFRKIRKVILTPTRILFMNPELIMSNRALTGADHDGTRIVRATFRDDNMGQMRPGALKDLLRITIMRHLTEGFSIAGREFGYLGSSNSQMRDSGAYFMERYSQKQKELEYGERKPPPNFKPKILYYRNSLGKFEEAGSIPKAMSRLGQCFTQARECKGFKLKTSDYTMIPDIVGASYVFTDGIGQISLALAKKIAISQKFPHRTVPSAFQIRFRGMKGMLAVNPGIDETLKRIQELYRSGLLFRPREMTGCEEIDLAPWMKHCLFRDSQVKFRQSRGGKEEWPLELVKWSSPSPVTLNRPFISILDHVSAHQSFHCHKRICDRIEEMLDMQMSSFTKFITSEQSCRSRLAEMPRRIHFASLQPQNGWHISTEPFFRALIKAYIDYSMVRLISKVQIQVPPELGRTMYGVTDESGELQYGQVFIQYSVNGGDKHPKPGAASKIVSGPVMVTKFPSIVGGDVRMFEAVDIPSLHHLNNVIVFPQSGPRPHPDEMAGSDLDGDEYAVIWDQQLYFENNESAFAYCSEKPTQHFNIDDMDVKMHEFYADYVEQDSVGQISVNHLQQSDQYGLHSNVCNTLAVKNSMALDFSKSGKAPAPLTTRWNCNPVTGKDEPPERAERVPDYYVLSQNRPVFVPMYTSSRLLGQLFRELRAVKDVIVASAERPIEVTPDKMLDWNGWQKYRKMAEEEMKSYTRQVRNLMDSYGILTEAEIFSGCYRELRNRISDRDGDDMSLFNTEYIVESRMTAIYKEFRERFFEGFVPNDGENDTRAFMKLTVPASDREDPDMDDVLRRICTQPSDEMKMKAVAYYKVCYEFAAANADRKLSFAWLAYDVLNIVRQQNLLASETLPEVRHTLPQHEAVSTHRDAYIKDNGIDFTKFCNKFWDPEIENEVQENTAKIIIRQYHKQYYGIEEYLYIIDSWARATRVLQDPRDDSSSRTDDEQREMMKASAGNKMRWYHLTLLAIMFATKRIGESGELDSNNGHAVLEKIEGTENPPEFIIISSDQLNRLTLGFFRYLASRSFRRLRHLSFDPIGLQSVFFRGEWLEYHKLAVKTYYNILLNLRFDELPLRSQSVLEARGPLRESIPFIIDLPRDVDVDKILNHLRKKSRCDEIQGRLENRNDRFARILISARGTVEAINDLRDMVTVKLPRNLYEVEKDMTGDFIRLVYYKITGQEWEDSSPPSPGQENRSPIERNNSRGQSGRGRGHNCRNNQ